MTLSGNSFATHFLVGTLLAGLISGLASGQTTQADRSDFDAALGMLRDTSLRMDSEGVQLTRTRLEPFAEDAQHAAEVYYYLGMADIASLFSADMTNQNADPAETLKRIDRALTSLKTSAELDDGSPETWSLLALVERFKSSVGKGDEQAALATASEEHLQHAERIDASDPVVMTVAGLTRLFSGGTDAMEGMALLAAAVEAHRAAMTGRREHDAGWWPLLARGMLARGQMMSGKNAEALALVMESLALDPDFTMVAMMKPRLESIVLSEGDGYLPIELRYMPHFQWAAVATDPPGDGRDTSLADGKAFAYHRDPRGGKLWFRFELHDEVDEDAFGVNVIVDSDADQATGTNWWGANSDFTWERIVTVWVARQDNGKYGGTVGVGDMAGMGTGDMAGLYRGDVDFAVFPEERAIVIGVPISHLTDGDRINVIGAVGTNQLWNDDLQDEGYTTIELR